MYPKICYRLVSVKTTVKWPGIDRTLNHSACTKANNIFMNLQTNYDNMMLNNN